MTNTLEMFHKVPGGKVSLVMDDDGLHVQAMGNETVHYSPTELAELGVTALQARRLFAMQFERLGFGYAPPPAITVDEAPAVTEPVTDDAPIVIPDPSPPPTEDESAVSGKKRK